MRELYDTNIDFKNYVDAYCKDRDICVEEAFSHAIVKSYAEVCK